MAGAHEPRGRRLPRTRRIRRGAEIRELFRRGKRGRTPHLDVLVAESPASFSRVGLVVPRYGNTAVRRNTVKRRLREALRREVLPRLDGRTAGGTAQGSAPGTGPGTEAGTDLLVRARREAYDADYRTLAAELAEWVERRWPASS